MTNEQRKTLKRMAHDVIAACNACDRDNDADAIYLAIEDLYNVSTGYELDETSD